MNDFLDKYNNALPIAVGIAISAMLKLNIPYVGPGFVIAIDVVAVSLCIYCFWEKFTPMQLAFIAAVVSPLSRFVVEYDGVYDRTENVLLVFPDAFFFIVYGIVFTVCVETFAKRPMPLNIYVVTVFLCDLIGNLAEVMITSCIWKTTLLSFRSFLILLSVAVLRTGITFLLLLAIEYYLDGYRLRDQQSKFRFIVNQSVAIADEFRVIESNKEDVERVMNEAYSLYSDMKENGFPEEYIRKTLEIARGAHEIKGAYQGVMASLEALRVDSEGETKLKMSDIVNFIKGSVQNNAKLNKKITINVHQSVDYEVHDSYKMISIVRNLVTNAGEAFKDEGTIDISIDSNEESGEKIYVIVVSDNGPGISKANLESIFIPGFSTKMNYETGNVQRGLGLTLVQEYVECDFKGKLEVESEVDKGTAFIVRIPAKSLNKKEL